jgi:hypothetical protein
MAQLNELEVEDYLADSVQIEPMALQEEYVRIAPDIAYWNARYSKALEMFLRSKIDLDTTEARQYIAHRERMLNAGAKVTKAQIEAAVTTDQQVIEARMLLVAAEVEKNRLNGVCEAVRTKRDMLVSLGAHVRAEMQGDPSLRTESADVRRRQGNGR